jgi:type IV pilus assembly protein PilE
MTMHSSFRRRGFTLIELMITVAIVAILASIAFPAYTSQVRKGKRAEGKAKILTAQQRLERYYTDNSTYTTDLAPLFGLAAAATVYSGDNNDSSSPYTITSAPLGTIAAGYTLTAAVNGGFTDPDCGNLTLTSTGIKGVGVGATKTVRECW